MCLQVYEMCLRPSVPAVLTFSTPGELPLKFQGVFYFLIVTNFAHPLQWGDGNDFWVHQLHLHMIQKIQRKSSKYSTSHDQRHIYSFSSQWVRWRLIDQFIGSSSSIHLQSSFMKLEQEKLNLLDFINTKYIYIYYCFAQKLYPFQ